MKDNPAVAFVWLCLICLTFFVFSSLPVCVLVQPLRDKKRTFGPETETKHVILVLVGVAYFVCCTVETCNTRCRWRSSGLGWGGFRNSGVDVCFSCACCCCVNVFRWWSNKTPRFLLRASYQPGRYNLVPETESFFFAYKSEFMFGWPSPKATLEETRTTSQ